MEINSSRESIPSRRALAGERRVVTILFSDVKGSTAMAEHLDPEDWAEIMNEAFDYLTKPIIRYGGTVARLMGDAILAFFGAPSAHEDDPLRAVLAGLDIVSGMQSFREHVSEEYDLDFNVRVGINTGVVVVGEMGSALAGEYTAMGDAVNLAARMEQTAKPGTVQITGETYRMVAPWVNVESLGGIEAKGKTEPVPAYCVLGQKEHPSRVRGIVGLASPMVGRDHEINRLETILDNLVQGRGQVVTLIGEAGLGKSRLIEEFHERYEVQTRGKGQWVETRGISYEITRPYGLITQAFRQVCEVNDEDPPDIIRNKVSESFKYLSLDQQSGITHTVELLFAIQSAPEGSEPQLEGQALKSEIFESVRYIWSELASDGPLVLVIDDLHWADSASVELLIHLFQLTESVPILFLCAFRPYRSSTAWEIKAAAETDFSLCYQEFSLAPLDEIESGQLVDNLLALSDLPAGLRETILQKSEGNPFFLEEVVRTLIDKGIIQQDETGLHWNADANYEQIDIPGNLQALLLARIDRLQTDARQTLQLASVVGRTFLYRVLQEIADNIENLDDQLVTLQNMDLIQVNSQHPELEYIFRNELTRDAAYQSILRRQRRKYHRYVGETIEVLFPDKFLEEAHQLAYHFNSARDYPRALNYFQKAGEQSFMLYANQEANEHYGRAIELALRLNVPSVQLARLYTYRGRALELLNQFDQALDNYEELDAEEGLRISQQIGNIWGQAYNHFVFGPILLERGDIDACLEALNATFQLSKEANFAAGLVATQMIKAWLYTMLGDLKTAERIQSEILSFVDQYESFKPLLLVTQAQHKLFASDHNEAKKIFEEIGRDYGTDSELIFHPFIFTLHVEIHLANQDFDIALQTAESYVQTLLTSQIKILVPDLLNQKARALIGLGRREDAHQELQTAHSLAEEQKSRRILWAILLDLADLESDQTIAEAYRKEAHKIIDYIAEHISNIELREHFLNLPKLREVNV